MSDPKKAAAAKTFRDLWVAGTVGGFLATLMRSVPLDAGVLAKGVDCAFTFDLVLRYVYLIWFIAYFFISNLDAEESSSWDIWFDIIQSIASYAAAFALGLVVRGEGYPFGRSAMAFGWANGAIFAICFLSLLMFGVREGLNKEKGVNWLRGIGAVVAAIACFIPKTDPLSGARLIALTSTLFALVVILIVYGRWRIAELKTN